MDSQQAKEILACYRAGRDDPADPHFAEALEQARRDPELAHWLAEQSSLDQVIGALIRESSIPLGLQSRILARATTAKPLVWWRQPVFLAVAAAAVVMVAFVLVWLLRPEPNTFTAYREKMAHLVSREYEMELKTKDLEQIRDYLAKKRWPADYVVSAGLQAVATEGCGALEWHGKPVSLICFEAPQEKDLFLFVVSRSVMPGAPATESPQFRQVGPLMTVSWSKAGTTYLLAARADEELLRKFL